MGKSRSRFDYEDEEWEEKQERFNRRREKRKAKDISQVIDDMLRKENEDAR